MNYLGNITKEKEKEDIQDLKIDVTAEVIIVWGGGSHFLFLSFYS